MEKKLTIALEIILLIVISTFITIKNVIPEYKSSIGSSDGFIKTKLYKNMFEVNIDNNVRYAYVIDENSNVYHMLFFDMNSTCLYNKNLEKHSVSDAVLESVKILIENDYLKNTSKITITKYDDFYYNSFIKIFKSCLNKYGISTNIITNSNALEKLCEEFELDYSESNEYALKELDIYSKEFTRVKKNSISDKSSDSTEYIREDNAREYTNNVYKKVKRYILDNKITSMDKYDNRLSISSIPADKDLKYYPSPNSWYYVKDGKLYAYIEIIDNGTSYSYCYNGSIDLNKNGECV